MSGYHRYEIRLRKIADGPVECRLGGKGPWRDTGLSMDTRYGNDTAETLGQLFFEFATITDIRQIERTLTYSRQQGIGRDLYRALFSRGLDATNVPWIHIVPQILDAGGTNAIEADNEFLNLVLRIPWAFLTSEDSTAAEFVLLRKTDPAIITIDAAPGEKHRPRFEIVRMPPYPKVLLICPTADTKTKGEEHGKKLQEALRGHYARVDLVDLVENVKLIRTFHEFEDSIEKFGPHIIYFYGHAQSQDEDTRLWFDADADDHYKGERSVEEIRQAIDRHPTGFPPVIWINACQGAAAERNNVLRLLAPKASAVITTRTLAVVKDSLELGRLILPKIVRGEAPHVAVREAVSELEAEAVRSARWATTIVAVQYGFWTSLHTEKRDIDDIESGGDFPLRLDRSAALNAIEAHLSETIAIQDATDKVQAVLWYGPKTQAPDIFEQRFSDLVVERFPAWAPIVRKVELQPDARLKKAPHQNWDTHFLESVFRGLKNILETPSPRLIKELIGHVPPDRIAPVLAALDASGSKLLVLSHGPFSTSHADMLRDYLVFWRSLYPMVTRSARNMRICLGLHFIEEADFEPPESAGDICVQSLGPVPLSELIEHIERYGSSYGIISNPVSTANKLINDYRGSFRPIYEHLKQRISPKW